MSFRLATIRSDLVKCEEEDRRNFGDVPEMLQRAHRVMHEDMTWMADRIEELERELKDWRTHPGGDAWSVADERSRVNLARIATLELHLFSGHGCDCRAWAQRRAAYLEAQNTAFRGKDAEGDAE